MRSQAEVISTAILLSVAIMIALGLVYYLGPQVTRSGMEYQVASRLSSYAASLSMTPIAAVNGSDSANFTFYLSDTGGQTFRVYLGVVVLYEGRPVDALAQYWFYNMTGPAAGLVPLSNWTLLPSLNTSARNIMVYAGSSGYSPLSIFGLRYALVYDAGLLQPGRGEVVRLYLRYVNPGLTYIVVAYARVGNTFYEIGRLPVAQP